MDFAFTSILVPLVLAIGALAMLELGRKFGLWRLSRGDQATSGGAIEGAVFAIFGLLVAFTFSGAASRFDERRVQIGQEANDIGTAWLRIDLLPAEQQPALRDLFRRYLDARLATYRNAKDMEVAMGKVEEANRLQGEMWTKAIVACHQEPSPATTTLVLTALNAMFDTASARLVATRIHPPMIIFFLLVALAFVCAFIAGNGLALEHPNRLHAIGFAVVISATVYVILDLEYPRLGFIRIDAADQVLYDLRSSMDPVRSP